MKAEMAQLVSIIIPCFNAERWVSEAIHSCLTQSYQPIEIIVIDDGSTDKSLEVIKSFGDKIRWETGPNRGGNHARNRGFALSKGEYIQFLDADDILDPKNIELQTPCLMRDQADVVVGSWRKLVENKDGSFTKESLKEIKIGPDALCSLLNSEAWAPPASHLYKRQYVELIGGWDESLKCLQDVRFNAELIKHGARFMSVPHFCAYYRRPLTTTTSTRSETLFMQACFSFHNDSQEYFDKTGWTEERVKTLTRCYGYLARYYYEHDRAMFERCLEKIHALNPDYLPEGPRRLRTLSRTIGYRNAEFVALTYRKLKKCFRHL